MSQHRVRTLALAAALLGPLAGACRPPPPPPIAPAPPPTALEARARQAPPADGQLLDPRDPSGQPATPSQPYANPQPPEQVPPMLPDGPGTIDDDAAPPAEPRTPPPLDGAGALPPGAPITELK